MTRHILTALMVCLAKFRIPMFVLKMTEAGGAVLRANKRKSL